ncbi:MAG: alpha/beta fold hydrolase [Hyphomonadaceae bacterium]|jgi:magnesium chelatase accessory protein|nr:alpha/beta fold hydrolase [Hyphomonadaceae bacterium]
MSLLALETDGTDWPNRVLSRMVHAAGLNWHVQDTGIGPGSALVLLHGTGASTHSWAGLLPILGQGSRVVACDLPGHAFTSRPRGGAASLDSMARLVPALLNALEISPAAVIGHSAGAAVALRAVLDGQLAPVPVVGINAALKPFPGAMGKIAPALARALFLNPFAAFLFARKAMDRAAVEKVLAGTGSRLTPAQIDWYHRLFQNAGHIDATLGMMAKWDLASLWEDLPRLESPLHLLVASHDRTVPPGDARQIQARVPHATITTLPGLGHLVHEEAPEVVATAIGRCLAPVPHEVAA